MKKLLQVSDELSLPIDVVTSRVSFLGTTGSGKTYGAMKLAEEMLDVGAQVVAIDPVGVWYGLRIGADGSSPGYSIPVFGGLHGDIPLEVEGGAYVADLIVDHNLSCILDVSQFEHDSDKAKFATAFAKRFFFRKKSSPSAVHIFLEECQEFVPQECARGEERMLHEFIRIWKIGRNFGIGGSLISQRPQEVNKKALNLTHVMFAFKMTGPHERKAVKDWIGDRGLEVSIVDSLPRLQTGKPHIWFPEKEISGVYQIAKKKTMNVSSTPEVGKVAAAKKLAPVDLERIKKEMAETIERAKADDPAELRKKISALEDEGARERQRCQTLSERLTEQQTPVVDDSKISDAYGAGYQEAMRVATEDDNARVKQMLQRFSEVAFRVIDDATTEISDTIGQLRTELKTEIQGIPVDEVLNLEHFKKQQPVGLGMYPPPFKIDASYLEPSDALMNMHRDIQKITGASIPPSSREVQGSRTATGFKQLREQVTSNAANNGSSSGLKLRIITVLAEWEAMRRMSLSRDALSALVDARGGYFANTLGLMRTEDLIEYPSPGQVSLTAAGRKQAPPVRPPRNHQEVFDRVVKTCSGLEERIARTLYSIFPNAIKRDQLSIKVDARGGYFANTVSSLRTRGLIEYPSSGYVRFAAWVFER